MNSADFENAKPRRKPWPRQLFACGVGLFMLAACAHALEINTALPRIRAQIENQSLRVELANTYESRRVGLMNRTRIGPNEGMLFVFEQEGKQCMWMKNTKMDLDVAFLDAKGILINIETMRAQSLQVHCSSSPALYALETQVDWFKSHAIRPGHKALFELP